METDYTVVGTVADGRALITEALRLKPDVIVVDIGVPLLNGLEAAERVRQKLPKVKLVFLTMQDNPNLAAAALELGSAAFVLKHSAGSELREYDINRDASAFKVSFAGAEDAERRRFDSLNLSWREELSTGAAMAMRHGDGGYEF